MAIIHSSQRHPRYDVIVMNETETARLKILIEVRREISPSSPGLAESVKPVNRFVIGAQSSDGKRRQRRAQTMPGKP